MKRMKQTHEKKNDNVIVVQVKLGRRLGHHTQRINLLDPNKRKYNRKEGKHVPQD